MATRANRIPAPSVEAADEAPPRRRRPAARIPARGVVLNDPLSLTDEQKPRSPTLVSGEIITPNFGQYLLAYAANYDVPPPWPMADRLLFGCTAAAGFLAVSFGALGIWA